jgi:DNA-binding response OmpR family regulator
MTEAHHPIRILLVEDDELDRSLFDRMLARTDMAETGVTWVDTLEVALRHIETQDVDVVLLDLDLPDSSGVATVERLRPYSPNAPILVLLDDDDGKKGMEAIGQIYPPATG